MMWTYFMTHLPLSEKYVSLCTNFPGVVQL